MHPDVVEVYHAGPGGADAELVLRLGDRQAGSLALHDEARDAFVALGG